MNAPLYNRLQQLQHLHGWCTQEKATAIANLVLGRKPSLVVEIGVFGGRAIGAMVMAAQFGGFPMRAVGIDPWTKDAALEDQGGGKDHAEWWSKLDLDKIYRDCLNGMRQLNIECEILRETDEQALGKFADESIDILHSDSNHSEVTSVRVTEQWDQKIKRGGILIFDDCKWPTQAKAVEIIRSRYDVLKEVVNDRESYIVAQRR